MARNVLAPTPATAGEVATTDHVTGAGRERYLGRDPKYKPGKPGSRRRDVIAWVEPNTVLHR